MPGVPKKIRHPKSDALNLYLLRWTSQEALLCAKAKRQQQLSAQSERESTPSFA